MDKIKKLILPSSNYKSRISLNDSLYYFTALHDEKTFTFFIQHMRFRNFSFLSSRSNIDDMISLPRFSNFRFCFPIPKELSNFAHQSLDKFLLSGDSMDHSFQLLPVSRDCNNFTRSSAFVRREVRKNSRRWARLLFGREKLSVNGMKNCVSPRIVLIEDLY